MSALGLHPGTLAGQVAVVTGGGQGIGREVARTLAELGARVVVAEAAETGRETEDSIRRAGGEALFVPADIADEAAVAALVERAEAAFGPADILVNNASVAPVASVADMPVDVWDRVVSVNLRGTFLMCKAVLPAMLARGRGTIVNMASTEAMPGLSAYIASKQGIAGFSRSLAAEVGAQGVRLLAFAPGLVDTPGLRRAADDLAPRLGLTPEAFLSLSLHPAYAGPMPASHAAAATAYLIARLADEYHGDVVDGYTVLERAGLIAGDRRSDPAAATRWSAPAERPATIAQAIHLSEQLHDALLQTNAEIDRLPIFVRPMARGAFRSKVGYHVRDAAHAVFRLGEQLQRMQASHSGQDLEFDIDYDRLVELLDRLIAYYQAVPTQTARFTRDEDLLKHLTELMARRVTLIRALLATLPTLRT